MDSQPRPGAQIPGGSRSESFLRRGTWSDHRFRLLVHAVRDYAIFMLDPDGTIVTWNVGARRLTGYDDADVLGRDCSILHTEDDVERDRPAELLELAARHGSCTEQGWRRRKDGSRVWVGIALDSVRDEDGQIVGFTCVMQDLSHEREVQQALRESEERLRFLFEDNPAMYFTADVAGRILSVNRFGAEHLGYTVEELTKLTIDELVHEADREALKRGLAECARTPGEVCTWEIRKLRKDGSVMWVREIVRPMRQADGELMVLIVCTDTTDVKRAEQERERLLAQQRFLAETSRVLADSIDYETTLQSVARLAVPVLADFSIVDVVGETGAIQRVATAHVDPEMEALAEQAQSYAPDPSLPEHPVNRVIRTGRSEVIRIRNDTVANIGRLTEHQRLIRTLRPIFDLVVPLVARGRTLGAIQFISLEGESGREYRAADIELAEDLARRASVAIDNARLYGAAEASRRTITQILESITDSFFALDRDWQVVYMNPEARSTIERALDRDAVRMIGQNFWIVWPDLAGSRIEREFRRAMEVQKPAHFETYAKPFGVWLEVHAYPSPEGLSVYFRDVTERREVQEALRESEERYRVLADMIPQHIWTADPDGQHTYFSRGWYEYGGTTPEEMHGEGWTTTLHPEDHDRTMARWRHSLRTGEPYAMEYRFRNAAGEYHWFLSQARPQRNEQGEIVRWVGTLTDIDEQKRAAEAQRFLSDAGRALASSLDYEETLSRVARLAVPKLADWCEVYLVGPDGAIRSADVAHRDPRKEALAREALAAEPEAPRNDVVWRVIQTGKPELVGKVSGEWLEGVAEMGHGVFRVAPRLGTRSMMIVPLRARGRTLGAVTLVVGDSGRIYDDRDLPQAESLADLAALAVDNAELYRSAELRAREEKALGDAVGAVGATSSTEEVIQQIAESAVEATGTNGAMVTRIVPAGGEVVARAGHVPPSLTEFAYGESCTRQVIEEQRPLLVDHLHELPGSILAAPLPDEFREWSALVVPLASAEQPIGALFLFRDPAQPRFSGEEVARAETFGGLAALAFRKLQMLEEAQRRREDLEWITQSRSNLMRGFSHDLKNPLGAADGHAALLEEGILGPLSGKQQESVHRIRRAIQTSLNLIHELLELARAESGQIELEIMKTDVAMTAREVVEDYRAQAKASGLSLDIRAPETLLIQTDPTRLRQVLGNLLSNALKYTEEGRITVVTEARRDGASFVGTRPGVAIHVIDTGRGIPPEKHEQIFLEFTRIDQGTRHGAGIGLAISRRIARLLGGDITVRSAVGSGSTFTLWLPETPPDASDEESFR